MRRRAFLSVCGVSLTALSGCAVLGEDAEAPTEQSTETPTKSRTDAPTRSPTESAARSCARSSAGSVHADGEFVATGKYDSFGFEFRNRTECPVTFDPNEAWGISAQSSDGWERVASEGGVGPDEERTLRVGDRHTWSLSLFEHPTPWGETTTYVFVDLPEGTYRFSVTATVDGDEEITRETTFDVVRRISTASDDETTPQ